MPGWLALVLALVALAVALWAAVVRPHRLPEAVVAGAGAGILLATGAIGAHAAGDAVGRIAPTVGFLAALLVLAEGCRREGLFEALGGVMARRSGHDERRLLALVFAAASATTIVLGLDATVVLLTPVVVLTVKRLRAAPRPPVYACAHLANSASLLLPVSNLTNLLAFRASGLSFLHFAGLMLLPTVAAVGVEWVVLASGGVWRREGGWPVPRGGSTAPGPTPTRALAGAVPETDEAAGPGPDGTAPPGGADTGPRSALIVVGLTLVGFALSSLLQIDPVWVAVAGATAITVPAVARGRADVPGLARSVQPDFLVFVLALSVVVAAAGEHGLTRAVQAVLPGGAGLGDLLVIAAVSAVLANLVNNLPATLILVPVAAALGPGPVLAVLVGVNVGPNLTEVGSLATLLWRRVLRGAGVDLPLSEFLRLGVISVPPALILATVLLWASNQVL